MLSIWWLDDEGDDEMNEGSIWFHSREEILSTESIVPGRLFLLFWFYLRVLWLNPLLQFLNYTPSQFDSQNFSRRKLLTRPFLEGCHKKGVSIKCKIGNTQLDTQSLLLWAAAAMSLHNRTQSSDRPTNKPTNLSYILVVGSINFN